MNESANLDEFIEYGIATGWHPLSEEAGVYYRHVVANGEEQTFSVLGGNSYNTSELSGAWNWSEDEVLVKPEVEKGDLNALDASGVESAAYPTLTFTAYAVQYEGFEDNPAAAWAQITSANTTTTTP